MYDLSFGGYGGRVDSDGPEALAPVMNCRNIPVEVHETNNPVRIHRLELIEDSGGAGRHRGGCGLRKDIELRVPSATVTLLGDHHVYAPYGVFGGHPGACAVTLLVRDGETESLGSKDMVELRRGDVLSFRLAGTGADTGIRRNATVKRYGAIWRMDSCRRTRRVRCTGSNWMEATEGYCCFSHSLVGSPRELVGVFRRRISWDDGVMREPAGAGDVAFPMNRCCRSGENVDARAPSVGKGWASAAHLSMPCPHGP